MNVAARHHEGVDPSQATPRRRPIIADLRDEKSVTDAVIGADAVANTVSLYAETPGLNFEDIHVKGAARLAEAAARAGVTRFVHVSGIGADPASSSAYIRARGDGELAVRGAFASATLLRPSAMFGPDDAFLTTLMTITRRLPVVPLFGHGETRLQPVSVEDVAEAAAHCMCAETPPPKLFELGGPEVFSYRELLSLVLRKSDRRRPLLPVPFAVWDGLAQLARLLPSPPLTEGQVALMKRDNVADPSLPGLEALDISPRHINEELRRRSGLG